MTSQATESQTPSPSLVSPKVELIRIGRIKIGKIHSLRAARRALVRVTEAVLAGRIEPKVANSAIYGLSSIGKLLETEFIEARIKALEEQQPGTARLVSEPRRLLGHS